jgi:CDP-glycerol glycerophosphotransferase (TagB/SpsB family)
MSYRGVRLESELATHLERTWESQGFILASYIDSINQFYKRRPHLSCVVLAHDVWPLSKLFALTARQRDIPTLVVQHGVTLDKPYYRIAYTPLSADYLAVWGEDSKSYWIAEGVDPERLIITGSPLFNPLANLQGHYDREKVCHQYGLDSNKKIVLYATQNFPAEKKQRVFFALLHALQAIPEAQLVVKLHPAMAETVEFYETILRQKGIDTHEENLFFFKQAEFNPLLAACDTLVTVHSTVHVEAAFLDKDVIIVNLDGDPDLSIVTHGAALSARTPDALKDALHEILYGAETRRTLRENRPSFITDYAYRNDGQAARRIVDLIYALSNDTLSPHA